MNRGSLREVIGFTTANFQLRALCYGEQGNLSNTATVKLPGKSVVVTSQTYQLHFPGIYVSHIYSENTYTIIYYDIQCKGTKTVQSV